MNMVTGEIKMIKDDWIFYLTQGMIVLFKELGKSGAFQCPKSEKWSLFLLIVFFSFDFIFPFSS